MHMTISQITTFIYATMDYSNSTSDAFWDDGFAFFDKLVLVFV